MITCYTGKPGSGKTLDVMFDIDSYLKHKRYVMSNFPVNASDFVKVVSSNDVTPKVIMEFFEGLRVTGKESEFLLVLDEAQTIFNSRTWVQNSKAGWIDFFTQHRKLGFEIILICQNVDMLDKQIRACIEYEVIHRRYSRFGVFGAFFAFLFGDFVRIKKWYGMKEVIKRESFRPNKRIYCMYDTNQIIKGV